MPNALDPTGHVNPDTIAAFAEGRIDAHSREAVERHLASCAECRRDVVHIVRLRRRPMRKWLVSAGAVAAAAVLLLMVTTRSESPSSVGPSSVRNAPDPSLTLGVITPDSVITIGGSGPRFVWRPIEPGARYEFTLTSEGGSRIYSTGTPDTSLALPDSVVLDLGKTYLWFVDALRPDGRTLTTGVRVLRTVP